MCGRRPFKGGRASTEVGLVVEQTFATAVMGHLYPRSQIDIFLEVLQSDGGTRARSPPGLTCTGTTTACMNAATLALMDAGVAMKATHMRDTASSSRRAGLCVRHHGGQH